MIKELDLKTIDSKEKAFLIGASSSHLIKYWKVSKELIAKNILRIEWCLASFNDDSFKGENQKEIIKNWFIRNFGDYIDKIEITPNKFGNENWWINIYFRITEDSKNNIEKYIPVKKDLYDYLPLSKTTIQKLLQQKIIPAIKIGRNYFITKQKLLSWIDENAGNEFNID